MVNAVTLAQLDVVTPEDLLGLASCHGPCVSVFLPTARHGPETLQGPRRLKKLLRQVALELEAAHGADAVDPILEPLRALVDDADFWQHQADGLALFASRDQQHRFRVPISLCESAFTGARFRLRPLLPLVAGDGTFFIVSLTQSNVRVFEATRQTIDELHTGPVPTSLDEALAHEDPERQLQSRSAGGSEMQFHGHGAGAELDKATLERYFRAVDRGLNVLLGSTRQPVVLACVDYYLPIYRSVTNLSNVADSVIAGSPDRRPPGELHAAALALIEPVRAARRAATADRFAALAGTGNTLTSIHDIAAAALQGRVDTLLIDEATAHRQTSEVEALIDQAVADVLTAGGTIETAERTISPDSPIAAILRY